MGHFTVLVISEERPTNDVLDRLLAPYHEFECTGVDNEYVQNVDETEEARKSFGEQKTTRYRNAAGDLFSPYEDKFYREPTPEDAKHIGPLGGTGCGHGISWHSKDWRDGKGYRPKVHFLPEGYEEVTLPISEVMSFEEFVEYEYSRKPVYGDDEPDLEDAHKYGWYRVRDGEVVEVINRTNPNSKWDWWKLGGRWAGFFKMKSGARLEAKYRDGSDAPERGEPGLMGSHKSPDGFDVLRKGDVDFEGMRNEAGAKASELWTKARAIIDPHLDGFVPWDEVRDEMFPKEFDKSREFYNNQPAVRSLLEASRKDDSLFWLKVEEFLCEHDDYVQRARDSALSTFAFVKDGQWVSRGDMGFWGMVSNEKDQAEWDKHYNDMMDSLPDHTWFAVVDCHI